MAKRQPPTEPKPATPRGEPFPRSLCISAKDAAPDIATKFATWVKLGELPATAILARFVGTAGEAPSGYVNEATGAPMGDEVDDLHTLCHLTVTGQVTRWYMIFSPQPASARS
jgi:hypothetical protein